MAADNADRSDPNPLDEFSRGLRQAVESVLRDPPPEDLTKRALDRARRSAAARSRRGARRIAVWAGVAAAASVAIVAVAMWVDKGDRSDGEMRTSLAHVTTPQDADGTRSVPAIFSTSPLWDELPTAQAYMQAARRSPEALDALLARHASGPYAARPPGTDEQGTFSADRPTF